MPLLPRPGGIPSPPPGMSPPPDPGMGARPPGMPPGLSGPPGLGGMPGMGGPPDMGMGGMPGMGGPPSFPSIDPAQVAGALGGVRQMQVQDQQSLLQQQQQVLSMLADAMSAAPNPAAQAAQTAPGYPTPPEEAMNP